MFSFDSAQLANLLALIGIALAILIPLLGYLYGQRRGIRNHFAVVWQLTRFLPPKKLLGTRPYYEYYLSSETDLPLETALKRRQNALVIGRPMSGKTRSVYQALRKKLWHITIPKTTDINSETFEFPKRWLWQLFFQPVVVVDDLHRFVEQQNFDVLLRAVMDRNIQLIATCRSGDDLKRTLNQLQAKGLEPSLYFPQRIHRQSIEAEIGQALAERLKLPWEPKNFDGTVGSVMMKLGEMTRRFEACSPEEKAILRSLQSLYWCGIYQGEQHFLLDWVKHWAKTLDLEGGKFEWTGWLESLQGKEFLILKEKAVEAEEAYLEDAVKPAVESSLLSLLDASLRIFEGDGDALNRLGNRAYDVGRLDYDNRGYLKLSIAAYRQALLEYTRERIPLKWAMTQNNLGLALRELGERESSTTRLEEAITAFRQALLERTRERVPLDWAATQNNLGTAIGTLSERESGTARLEEAITAFHQALMEWTRKRTPLAWAGIQNNLGLALRQLGERESDTTRLEEAVTTHRQALLEYTRERVPLDWASTQKNLGTVLQLLGSRESGTARMEEAVTAYRQALLEYTRERAPLDWASTQNNLGNTLRALGERESGTARLEEAVTTCRQALLEWTRERAPLDWAAAQNNLGAALWVLGERESSTARMEEAVTAYRQALLEYTRERAPLDWAGTQNNLGIALGVLGERESSTARMEEAFTAYRQALLERTRKRAPLDWATTQNNLGNALQGLGKQESGTGHLEEAVTAYHQALLEWTRERVPIYWAFAQNNLGNALLILGERTQNLEQLEQAKRAIQNAYDLHREAGNKHHYQGFEKRLAGIDKAIATLQH